MIRLVEQLRQLQEKKWRKWVETFEDEDTHEMVDVEREELLTTETSDEEHELWQQIIPELPKLSDEELRTLQRQILSTDIDNIPIVEVLALRGDVDALSQIGDIATLQELCEQGNQDAARELYEQACSGCYNTT
jgi:DNA-directed RNA polymerase beta' subunit